MASRGRNFVTKRGSCAEAARELLRCIQGTGFLGIAALHDVGIRCFSKSGFLFWSPKDRGFRLQRLLVTTTIIITDT